MSETIRRGPKRDRLQERPVLVHVLMPQALADGLDELAWEKRVNRSELLRQLAAAAVKEDRTP